MSDQIKKKRKWPKFIVIGYILAAVTVVAYTSTFNYQRLPGIPLLENAEESGNALNLLNSRARLHQKNGNRVTFDDVAGISEVLDDLSEIADFVKSSEKYRALGAKIPRGVLLVGPPGTGKTLIAKAIAGETERPFYSISGSEFVEMYIGVGASRVRKLFKEARENGPSIIFIDEIDAIGSKREASADSNERIQTLNQLLTEMDGFNDDANVIVIAATNRMDSLDPALLRSGRFDRRVWVPLPDMKARREILELHAERIAIDDHVDLKKVARATSGASGADLANILNEAALLAAREEAECVVEEHLEEARNRVLFGSEARRVVLNPREKKATAYHEAGHAIISHLVQHATPADKVTIIPRGSSLGHTEFCPEEEQHSYWKNELPDRLAVLLGGRVAEEIFLGDVSSGAENDIEKATALAKSMILKWGMSDKIGLPTGYDYSEETARKIDGEVRRLLDEAYARAKNLLTQHRRETKRLVDLLLEHETVDSEGIKAVLQHH